jgi:hypothetical protein
MSLAEAIFDTITHSETFAATITHAQNVILSSDTETVMGVLEEMIGHAIDFGFEILETLLMIV